MAELGDNPRGDLQNKNNAALMGDTNVTYQESAAAQPKTVMVVDRDSGQAEFVTVDAIVTRSSGAGASYEAMSKRLQAEREKAALAHAIQERDALLYNINNGIGDKKGNMMALANLNKTLGLAEDAMG